MRLVCFVIFVLVLVFTIIWRYVKKKQKRNLYAKDLRKLRRLIDWYYNTYLNKQTSKLTPDIIDFYNLEEATPLDILIYTFKNLDGKLSYSDQMNMELALFRHAEFIAGFVANIKNEYELESPTMVDSDFSKGFTMCNLVLMEWNDTVFKQRINIQKAINSQNAHCIINQLRTLGIISKL